MFLVHDSLWEPDDWDKNCETTDMFGNYPPKPIKYQCEYPVYTRN